MFFDTSDYKNTAYQKSHTIAGFFQYNAMLSLQPSWDDCFKILIPDMNPILLRQLMVNRCEVNDVENAEEADKTSYENVLTYLNDQLLDKTQYEKPN